MSRADMVHALCTQVALELRRALAMLEVELHIYPTWEDRPLITMDLAELEAARTYIGNMQDDDPRKGHARHAIRLGRSAVHVTISHEPSTVALENIARRAQELCRDIRADLFPMPSS